MKFIISFCSITILLCGIIVIYISQAEANYDPDPPVIVDYLFPKNELLPIDAKHAIREALLAWNYPFPQNGRFSMLSLRLESNWALATLTSADLNAPPIPGQETSIFNGRVFNLVLTYDNKRWRAAIEGDENIYELLNLIPETELSNGAKDALFSLSTKSVDQVYNNYKFPWPSDRPWHNHGGWHGTSDLAIDFDVVDNTNSDVLVAAPGYISNLIPCSPSDHYIIRITTENTNEQITLIHLDGNTVRAEGLQQGNYVPQGKKLGRMAGAFSGSDSCGIYSDGTHLHVEFPMKPFTIDGKTYTDSYWYNGVYLYSSNNQNGNTCSSTVPLPSGYTKCADEGGTCSFSGTADVAYGANDKYTIKTGISNNIACTNDAFGCDPNYGTTKECYFKIEDGNICNTTVPLPSGYTKCADEGGTCNFSGTSNVYYGASGKFTYKTH